MKNVLIEVTGQVHHVGYRYYTLQKAEMLSIKGFVKNMPDGSVYIEALGRVKDIEVFADYLKVGPSLSRVKEIFIQDIPKNLFKDFSIR